VNRQIGDTDFKYVGKICSDVHATWHSACAVAPNALTIVAYATHNSKTDRRRIFKLGGWDLHVTCYVWPPSKVKVT